MSKVTYDLDLNTTRFDRKLGKSDRKVGGFASRIDRIGRKALGSSGGIRSLNTEIGSLIGPLTLGAAVVGVGALTKKIVDLGAEMEQTRISFTTFLGDADKANKLIKELNQFANVTPFDNEQVIKASRTLLAFGINNKDIIPTMRILGDVAAGTGKDLSELGVIYGQIRGAGRLMGQDLLQLINAGFNPLQTISKNTGKSMSLLKDEMRKGKISFQQVRQAFVDATGEGGLFNNLMKKQSKSAKGLASTFKGKLQLAMIKHGEIWSKKLVPVYKTGIGLIDKLFLSGKKLEDQLLTETTRARSLFRVLEKGNLTQKQRKVIIGKINDQYGSYLPNLLTEKDSINQIAAANSILIRRLKEKIILQSQEEKIRKSLGKQIELEELELKIKTRLSDFDRLSKIRTDAVRQKLGKELGIDEELTKSQSLLKLAIDLDSEQLKNTQKEIKDIDKEIAKIQVSAKGLLDKIGLDDTPKFADENKNQVATKPTGTKIKSVSSGIGGSGVKNVTLNINTVKAAEKIILEKGKEGMVQIEEAVKRVIVNAASDGAILTGQ